MPKEVVIPNGFGQLQIRVNSRGLHNCINLAGFSFGDPPDQTALNALSTVIGTAYRSALSTSSSYTSIHVLYRDGGVLLEGGSDTHHGVGDRSDPKTTPQVQAMAKKSTGIVGRPFTGRMFFPDVLEQHVDDNGLMDAGEIAKWQDVADAIHSGLTGIGTPFVNHVLLHSHDVGGPAPPAPSPVTTFVVEAKVATLRRRYRR